MATDEQWNEDSDHPIAKCDRCGEIRPCQLSHDPFVAEIYPEQLDGKDKTWWCLPCYSLQCDEV